MPALPARCPSALARVAASALLALAAGCGDEATAPTADATPADVTDPKDAAHADTSADVSADTLEEPDAVCPPGADYPAIAPIVEAACLPCHSAALSGAARLGAPEGVDFDDEAALVAHAERVHVRAVVEQTMPPGAPLSDCERQALAAYLDALPCAPDCEGRACGDDGCGGSCGACGENAACVDGGCVCEPACEGKACGDDGCGGSCGACDAGQACDAAGQCACVPGCAGKACGPDGCGGSCGQCPGALLCQTATGQCVASCEGSCEGMDCGDDGCGGSCGACAGGQVCDGAGQCVCAPDCDGRQCGPDGCGGACGTCPAGSVCSDAGQCECVPDCAGKVCGDDGCGGSCGACGAGQGCQAGLCVDGPSWSADVYPLFQAECTGSCHGNGPKPSAGLNLGSAATAWAELVNVASTQCSNEVLVVPGDPGASYLVAKLKGVGMCFGSRMPKGGPFFTAAQMQQLEAWIGAGALND